MDKNDILSVLRRHEDDLHRRGVLHAALFGSVARDEARQDSDIDIMVELDPKAPIGVYEYVAITHFIGDLFPQPVDVAERGALKPHVLPAADRDALYAF